MSEFHGWMQYTLYDNSWLIRPGLGSPYGSYTGALESTLLISSLFPGQPTFKPSLWVPLHSLLLSLSPAPLPLSLSPSLPSSLNLSFTCPSRRGEIRRVRCGEGTNKNQPGDIFPPLLKQIMYFIFCLPSERERVGSFYPVLCALTSLGKQATFQHRAIPHPR